MQKQLLARWLLTTIVLAVIVSLGMLPAGTPAAQADGQGCSAADSCFVWELLDVTPVGSNVQLRFKLTVNCDRALDRATFELPAGRSAVSPTNNSTYTSPNGYTYHVKNPVKSPFHGIRFDFVSGSPEIKNGQSDIFIYTLAARDWNPAATIRLEARAGTLTGLSSINPQACLDPGTASIGDLVWLDTDLNGAPDAGEAGIEGVVLNLFARQCALVVPGDTPLLTTTTAGGGLYAFTNLVAGNYCVQVDDSNFAAGGALAGLAYTPDPVIAPEARDVTLSVGQTLTGADFGYVDTSASLVKTASADGNCPGTADLTIYDPGTVTYCYDVTNTGHSYLKNLSLIDDKLGVLGFNSDPLAPGAHWSVSTAAQIITTTVNVASVTGVPSTFKGRELAGDPATAMATATVTYIPRAVIGDRVWEDLNANGVQDDGESGIPGVTVELYDHLGNLKGITTTNASGLYSFNPIPGRYYVRFTAPDGYVFSPMDQGSDDGVDSDADPNTGQTAVTTLTPTENDLTWDAGLYRYASLGDLIWQDVNGDGIQDGGETGLEGVTVKLYDGSHSLVATTATDVSGNYAFTGLVPGSYYLVIVAPTGYVFSPQDQGGDDSLDSDADIDTGKTAPTVLISGENELTWDAGLYIAGSIGDFVWNDTDGDMLQGPIEPGLEGVVVGLTLPGGTVITTTTDVNGAYHFTGLRAASYVVDVVSAPPGYFLTTGNTPLAVTLAVSENYSAADFGYAGKGSMTGGVFYDWDMDGTPDIGEEGVGGVQMCLYRDEDHSGTLEVPGDTQLECQLTDPAGSYAFVEQMPGDYLVVEVQPEGLESTTPNESFVDLVVRGAGSVSEQRDFGEIAYVSIGDLVWVDSNGDGVRDPDEPGMFGVSLQLTGTDAKGDSVSRTTTSLDGSYRFYDLLPGTYTVTAPETFNGFLLLDVSAKTTTLTVSDREDLTLDFRYAYPTGVALTRFDLAAEADRVVLTWIVYDSGQEEFIVWRADNAKGFGAVRLTETPVAGDADGSYRFVDDAVLSDHSYWYWLEDVGTGQRYGPQAITVPAAPAMRVRMFLPMVGGR